tara:strand:- start:6419 stop:6553 length:135 start_codon:yes stop_codon:yes gene_type:complete
MIVLFLLGLKDDFGLVWKIRWWPLPDLNRGPADYEFFKGWFYVC